MGDLFPEGPFLDWPDLAGSRPQTTQEMFTYYILKAICKEHYQIFSGEPPVQAVLTFTTSDGLQPVCHCSGGGPYS